MKRILFGLLAVMLAVQGFAQTDTTKKADGVDTIHVGNFIIIQRNKDRNSGSSNYDSGYGYRNYNNININLFRNNHRNYHGNVSTNWFIFDLGFANWNDKTAYGTQEVNDFLKTPAGGAPFTKSDLKLLTVKSTNVNIWFFMQKLNITSHVLNLKYGLGLEMFNFRYDNNITYHKDPVYIFRDSVDFRKNKLYAGYLTVPLMLNINTTPGKRRGFSFSGGISAGYRVGTHTKQKSSERGKVKQSGDFDLDPWRIAYIAELGIGPIRLYGSYSVNPLQQDAVKQYPYAVGIRFSNW